MTLPAAHLSPARGAPRGAGAALRAHPVSPGPLGPAPTLPAVLDYLDVERSPRYAPAPGRTYCNVYAHDVLHLLGLYLPRVWWRDPAAAAAGPVTPQWGATVAELTANALYDWAAAFGADFGWAPCDEREAQARVNARGLPGFIVAWAPRRTGHITVLLPEAPFGAGPGALSGEGPLQSEAGARCRRLFRGRWWANPRHGFRDVAFYTQRLAGAV